MKVPRQPSEGWPLAQGENPTQIAMLPANTNFPGPLTVPLGLSMDGPQKNSILDIFLSSIRKGKPKDHIMMNNKWTKENQLTII